MRTLLIALLLATSSTAQTWNLEAKRLQDEVKGFKVERESLINKEEDLRQGHEFFTKMSKTCQDAQEIVEKIKQDDMKQFWNNIPGRGFAGEMFPLARDIIERTKLWKVIQRMPKGALLHGHLKAMGPIDFLVDEVLSHNNMYFYVSDPNDLRTADIQFCHRKTGKPVAKIEKKRCKLSECSTSESSIPVNTVAREYFGGNQNAFRDFLKSRMMVERKKSKQHYLGVDEIWRQFNAASKVWGHMLTYEPVVKAYYEKLFTDLREDGINWVEFRAGGSDCDLVPENEEYPDESRLAWWRVMVKSIKAFKDSQTQDGIEEHDKLWDFRVIWSDSRGKQGENLTEKMKMAFRAKRRYPELISGYDLVGQEDSGHPLVKLLPELLLFQHNSENPERMSKLKNGSIPFFFHAGETLGDFNPTDKNLYDAILLRSRRIGHGFSAYKHPILMEKLRNENVLLEVCPISHEVLRLTTDILHHPLPALLANNVSVAISNDDPGMLGQRDPGLSFDFYQVIQAFDEIKLSGLGAMAQNSIRWSNFEDETHDEWIQGIRLPIDGSLKKHRLQQWNNRWEKYCEWIVEHRHQLANLPANIAQQHTDSANDLQVNEDQPGEL